MNAKLFLPTRGVQDGKGHQARTIALDDCRTYPSQTRLVSVKGSWVDDEMKRASEHAVAAVLNYLAMAFEGTVGESFLDSYIRVTDTANELIPKDHVSFEFEDKGGIVGSSSALAFATG